MASATVIAFPRRPQTGLLTPPVPASEILLPAPASDILLAEALRHRKAALQTWHLALSDLTLGLAALTHSLECCREALVDLDTLTLAMRETA